MNYGKLPDSAYNLKFDKTVRLWDEAVPLGNGQCGALIWGEPGHLRFSLDRGDIWDTTPDPSVFSEEFTYQNMVRLAEEKNELPTNESVNAPTSEAALPAKDSAPRRRGRKPKAEAADAAPVLRLPAAAKIV